MARRSAFTIRSPSTLPQAWRLLLALLFLTADMGDHIVEHLGPGLKGFAGTGDGLIGADQRLVQTVLARRGCRAGT